MATLAALARDFEGVGFSVRGGYVNRTIALTALTGLPASSSTSSPLSRVSC